MELTYDPRYNVAYLRFRNRLVEVKTISVTAVLNVDVGPDGTVYGIEFLDANRQLGGTLVVENQATGERREVGLW